MLLIIICEQKMKKMGLLFILLSFFTISANADVSVCSRTADVLAGIFEHQWIKTNEVEAGMGGAIYEDALIGDRFEMPYTTEVYVRDHSNDRPEKCLPKYHVVEDCVNEELEIGKYLGQWHMFNNCQTFVSEVLRKCEYPRIKAFRKSMRHKDSHEKSIMRRQLRKLIKSYNPNI